MKKKLSPTHKKKVPSSQSAIKLHYIVIFFGLILVTFGSVKLYQRPRVLGASIYLANDDSGISLGGGDSGSGFSSSGPSTNSGFHSDSGGSGSVSESSGGSTNSDEGISEHALPENSQVDCVGPDSKHFTTDFKNCFALNSAWHEPNFSFTPLSIHSADSTEKTTEHEVPEPTSGAGRIENETAVHNTEKKDELEVRIEGSGEKLELHQGGTKVELHLEGDKVVVKAKKEDGTETELESNDALEKLNETLAQQNVAVGTDEAKGLVIRKGAVEAHTNLPISVDPITNEITVTTSTGTKTVAVLPDTAVQNILNAKVLSTIENNVTTTPTGTKVTSENVTLTTLHNEPVFTIDGASNKKILGLLPISFAKQAVVSAETGTLIQTNETLFNKILEALSF